ncbi:hypothetical protein LMF57_12545 [Stenotrophomonas sp. SI-NJAU-1]|uniref:hypothetical protein n=1 Tax=Stenotrophomonas sp. SI-NJAU-1 TaxID=2886359 RepID=UPI001E2B5778|nr:hypothetical protein [Stenotrophomonas sp. SI-NJAU-1]UEX16843.1 hypothetical protein LMF57_12545 [Stenotrophomonas sp. SI-NJAU-1]
MQHILEGLPHLAVRATFGRTIVGADAHGVPTGRQWLEHQPVPVGRSQSRVVVIRIHAEATFALHPVQAHVTQRLPVQQHHSADKMVVVDGRAGLQPIG